MFIVVISPRSLRSPNIAVEVGAATAWSKSIFPVRHRVSSTALPTYLRSYKTFSSSELKALSRAVQTGLSPLTDDQLGALRKLYVQFGVPSDRLASYPASLESLTTKFNRAAKATLSSERLLQEILRHANLGNGRRSKE